MAVYVIINYSLAVLAVIDANDGILASVVLLLQLKFQFLLNSSTFTWVPNSMLHKKHVFSS